MHETRYIVLALLALTVGAASCVSPISPENADPPLRTSIVPDDTWERVIRPGFGGSTGFSFSLPPRFEKLPVQPIDSDAGVYIRQEASIHYDFGPYTSAPDAEGTDEVMRRMQIADRTALVVSYRRTDGRRVVAAWWKEVSRSAVGANHLLMVSEFSSEADRPEILAAIYSVRFP